MNRYIKWVTALALAAVIAFSIVPICAFAEELIGDNNQQAVQMRMDQEAAELAVPMTDFGFEGMAFLVSLSIAFLLQLVRPKWTEIRAFLEEKQYVGEKKY